MFLVHPLLQCVLQNVSVSFQRYTSYLVPFGIGRWLTTIDGHMKLITIARMRAVGQSAEDCMSILNISEQYPNLSMLEPVL